MDFTKLDGIEVLLRVLFAEQVATGFPLPNRRRRLCAETRRARADVRAHGAALTQRLDALAAAGGVTAWADLLPPSFRQLLAPAALPRFVRVNTARLQCAAAEKLLDRARWRRVPFAADGAYAPRTYARDPVLPDMLALAPDASIHAMDAVRDGALVLQSRASALVAHALGDVTGATVLDMCAAPGSKTLHVAARGAARVYANDRDPKRVRLLWRRTCALGLRGTVRTLRRDALELAPSDFLDGAPTHVIVDPTCSGSGVARLPDVALSRIRFPLEAEPAADIELCRQLVAPEPPLDEFQAAQAALLRHALSLPSAQVVAYSTCSIHAEENEEVVRMVLRGRLKDGTKASKVWRLKKALPAWKTRGRKLDGARLKHRRCLRASQADLTDGFFVAVLARRK